MVHINEIVRGMCCTKRRAAFKSTIPAGRRALNWELGRHVWSASVRRASLSSDLLLC